jgi:hypothetical protein
MINETQVFNIIMATTKVTMRVDKTTIIASSHSYILAMTTNRLRR